MSNLVFGGSDSSVLKKFLLILRSIGAWDTIKYSFTYLFSRKSRLFKQLDSELAIFKRFIAEKYKISGSIFESELTLKTTNHKLVLRRKSSDNQVVEQIFLKEEYRQPKNIIRDRINLNERPCVVDAGGNIGCSALYFATHFPNSILTVLEPFPDTFKQMKRNLELNHIHFNAYQTALWSRKALLDFDMGFRDGKEWSVRTVEHSNGKVKALGLNDLIQDLNSENIDVLKVDIEGSEFEVFLNSSENVSSLKKVKSLVMEIHDDAGDRRALYSVFEPNFEIHELGELTLFLNKHFLK